MYVAYFRARKIRLHFQSLQQKELVSVRCLQRFDFKIHDSKIDQNGRNIVLDLSLYLDYLCLRL